MGLYGVAMLLSLGRIEIDVNIQNRCFRGIEKTGYNTTRLLKEKLLNEYAKQYLRNGEIVVTITLYVCY